MLSCEYISVGVFGSWMVSCVFSFGTSHKSIFVQRSKWQPLRTEQRRKRTTHKHAKTRRTQHTESRKQLSGKAGTTANHSQQHGAHDLSTLMFRTSPGFVYLSRLSTFDPLDGSCILRCSLTSPNSKASSVNSCALRAEREALTLKKMKGHK